MKLVLPIAAHRPDSVEPASPPAVGMPLRLGLLHNCKPNGDTILASAHAGLVERGFAAPEAVSRAKHTAGEGMRGEVRDDLLQCDLVLNALAC